MRPNFGFPTVIVAVAATLFAAQLRSSLAQDPAPPTQAETAAAPLSEAATRGQAVFKEKCTMCHNADSADAKIGPGLKGFTKRGTFTSDQSKVTDESLTTFIQNGKGMMPAFKTILEPAQIKD